MKLKLILALTLMNISIGERRLKKSTVLTDESKRILEQFDFSNFDKQEALNYIDRQRYDNLIRGKRSKSKIRRDFPEARSNNVTNAESHSEPDSKHFNLENDKIFDFVNLSSTEPVQKDCIFPENDYEIVSSFIRASVREKRGRHRKRKHKIKPYQQLTHDMEDYDEDEEEEARYRKRKRKKKRKRRYWNNWTPWSPCSVTCGRGRKIRWRKCIVKNCTTGELEMGEKTCQLPACNLLTKLLADIKNVKLGLNQLD